MVKSKNKKGVISRDTIDLISSTRWKKRQEKQSRRRCDKCSASFAQHFTSIMINALVFD